MGSVRILSLNETSVRPDTGVQVQVEDVSSMKLHILVSFIFFFLVTLHIELKGN